MRVSYLSANCCMLLWWNRNIPLISHHCRWRWWGWLIPPHTSHSNPHSSGIQNYFSKLSQSWWSSFWIMNILAEWNPKCHKGSSYINEDHDSSKSTKFHVIEINGFDVECRRMENRLENLERFKYCMTISESIALCIAFIPMRSTVRAGEPIA